MVGLYFFYRTNVIFLGVTFSVFLSCEGYMKSKYFDY